MTSLPIKTVADIRALNSRHAVAFYLPANWRGTALDILRLDAAPHEVRLAVVLNEGWLPVAIMVSFAQWCAADAADAAKASAAADHFAASAAYAADVYADAAKAAYFAAKANAHAFAAADAYADAANSAYFAAKANAHAFAAADAYAAAEAAACEKQVVELIRLLE